MKVMKDQNLNRHHTMAVQAVTFIFNILGVRSVQYIQYVLPPFLNIIRTGDAHIREVNSLNYYSKTNFFCLQ